MAAAGVNLDVLDASLLRDIARRGGIRRFPANAVVINEGDVADSIYIVLSGRLKVYSTNAEGKAVVITVHGTGETVGELSLDGGTRSASVMTLEPTTCSIVSGANLRAFIAEHPDFALHLIRKLIWRVRHATDRVKSLALDDVYERVVRLLNEVPQGVGDERVVGERLTQQDIAERVGASREMVSRILKDLTLGGYISVKSSRITLLKRLPAHW
jgi:CRP/FNR family transcriptional regulator, cyclic AMP receptor protein